MNILEVTNKKTINEFNKVPKILYKNDKNWSAPLDIEINGIFDPANNKCFQFGDAKRWIAKDNNGKLIGRISAFYDKRKINKNNKQPTGGIGFFESINDKKTAFALFDTAKNWLKEQGMEAMDGPVTFGENITYWGLLVEGFTHQAYGMQYHFPYYKELFEEYGFKDYFKQFSYHVDLSKPFPERQVKFAKFIARKPNYKFRHFKFSESEKYLKDVVYIYNKVWADFHADYTPLEYEDIKKTFMDAKELLNEELIWFAYDEDQPIGVLVNFPDVNQITKKINGKLNLINKLKFLKYKKDGTITRSRLLMSGVIPEHQRTGIVAPLFLEMIDGLKNNGIKELEMSWVGEYNKTVNKMYKQMGAEKAKMHITYRYLFDREAEFERFTNEQAPKAQKVYKK